MVGGRCWFLLVLEVCYLGVVDDVNSPSKEAEKCGILEVQS